MKWVLKQSETILSARDVQRELFGFQYVTPWMVSDVHVHLANIVINTMRTKLSRGMSSFQSVMMAGVKEGVDNELGLDEVHWKDVCLFDFMSDVTRQVTMQVWVGESLFYNKAFFNAFKDLTTWLGGSTVVLSSWIPPVFATVLGLLLQIPVKICFYRCNKHLLSVVRKRWEQVERAMKDRSITEDDVPNDFITWTVKSAMAERYSKVSCPEHLSTLLLIVASLHFSGLI